MRRRPYLARVVSIVTTVIAAGCTERALEDAEKRPPLFEEFRDEGEIDLPVEQKYDVVVEGVERAAETAIEESDGFEEYLLDEGVEVEHLGVIERADETILELEYVSERTIERGTAHDLGIVAGGFAALIRGGFDCRRLEASVLDSDGRRYGAFEAEAAWAEEYVEGTASAGKYGSEVLRTLETKRSVSAGASNGGSLRRG